MGSNEELSDLDLALLGEERSTPVNTNERPATSPGPVTVSSTKAPTQAGSTNKSGSSTSPDRIHVSSTKAPTQAGSTNKSGSSTSPDPIHVSSTKAPTQAGSTNKSGSSTSPDRIHVSSTKAPTQAGFTNKSGSSTSPDPSTKAPTQAESTNKSGLSTSPDRIHVFGTTSPVQAGFTINSVHLPSVFGPVVTPKVPQNPTTNNTTALPSDPQLIFTSRTLLKPTTDATPLPSGHHSSSTPTKLQNPIMSDEGMSDKTDSVRAELEDPNKSNASFTRSEVMDLMRKCKKAEKVKEDISKKLSQTEAQNTALKEELKVSGKKLSSTEGENAELNHRYARAEEALRVKVQQALQDGQRAQVTEQNFEKLKTEHETLQQVYTVLDHKSKTQGPQVVACEKKVTKTMKELATYKAAAEAKEGRLQQSIANLKKGLEDSTRLIRSSGMDERRAELDGLSAHVDDFEESRRIWVETQTKLEDDLAAVKADLDVKEQKILSMVEENKKLMQAKKDLKKANQDLRHQQNTQTGSTIKGAQASSKPFTQTDYSTDEDQGSLDKKPQRSVGEHFHDFGIQSGNQSGNDEASEEEDKTVTIRNFNPPSTNEGWTQPEEEKTVTLGGSKPAALGDGWTPAQATNSEYSLLFSMDRAPVPPADIPSQGPKLGLSPIFAVDSAPVPPSHGPKLGRSPIFAVDIAPVPPTGIPSQGPKLGLSPIFAVDIAPVPPTGIPSQGPKLERSPIFAVDIAPVSIVEGPLPRKATESQGVQTELTSTQWEGVQTEPIATKSQAVQKEPEETINSNEKKPWYLRNYTQVIFGTVVVSALLMLLFWAWSQCQAATKERKMWMQANDHAYRLSDEVIRKQAIALLLRTPDRARLGWLTPEKIMTLHRGAHHAFTHTFHPLILPTRSISTPSLVQSAMAPTPATTRMGAWPAWSDSL